MRKNNWIKKDMIVFTKNELENIIEVILELQLNEKQLNRFIRYLEMANSIENIEKNEVKK